MTKLLAPTLAALLLAIVVLPAGAETSTDASGARNDGAHHAVKRGRGTDDGPGHARQGRGADDPAGDDNGGDRKKNGKNKKKAKKKGKGRNGSHHGPNHT